MKYGRLTFNTKSVNIGDNAMLIGIDKIYEYMGVPKEDIIDVGRPDIPKYNGEPVILPIYSPIVSEVIKLDGGRFPSSIIPVFISTHCTDPLGVTAIANSSYGMPILCRDEPTVRMLKKAGCQALYFGCISVLLSKREKEPVSGKVFVCEIEDELWDYMPDDIKGNVAELNSQSVTLDSSLSPQERGKVSYNLMVERLKLLKKEACLVVSSRLHLILPCIAMGIPTILATRRRDERFGCLARFTPVYTVNEYKNIDWYPKPIDIEGIKQRMLKISAKTIQYAHNSYESRNDIQNEVVQLNDVLQYKEKYHYQLYSPYRGYVNIKQALSFVENKNDNFISDLSGKKPEEIDIVFFGTGNVGAHFYYNISGVLKACKSFAFMDNNPCMQGKKIFGHIVKKPSQLPEYDKDNLIVFITMNGFQDGASEQVANQLVKEYSLTEGVNYFLVEFVYNTAMQLWTHGKHHPEDYRNTASNDSWKLIIGRGK